MKPGQLVEFERARVNRERRRTYFLESFPNSAAPSLNAQPNVTGCGNLNRHQNEEPSETNDA